MRNVTLRRAIAPMPHKLMQLGTHARHLEDDAGASALADDILLPRSCSFNDIVRSVLL